MENDLLLQKALRSFLEGYKLDTQSRIAIALSGGPDSMALAHALCNVADQKNIIIHAFIVDHNLRDNSAAEAAHVANIVDSFPRLNVHILTRSKQQKGAARLQETARDDRYALLESACIERDIQHLFLAHHQDDQAETFLFRLAKGSGLDGLGGIKPKQKRGALYLCRPFLDISKTELLEYCARNNVPFVTDPSNEDDQFARVRLRQARAVLEEEGLSAKRLSVTARRLQRAQSALHVMAAQAFERARTRNKAEENDSKRLSLSLDELSAQPDEIRLRVIQMAMDELQASSLVDDVKKTGSYGPRLERVEDLCEALFSQATFKRRSLGGMLFSKDVAKRLIIVELERKDAKLESS
jgi:tRNA(Ile)-lysidine synthase